jgi:hypothetical protein
MAPVVVSPNLPLSSFGHKTNSRRACPWPHLSTIASRVWSFQITLWILPTTLVVPVTLDKAIHNGSRRRRKSTFLHGILDIIVDGSHFHQMDAIVNGEHFFQAPIFWFTDIGKDQPTTHPVAKSLPLLEWHCVVDPDPHTVTNRYSRPNR